MSTMTLKQIQNVIKDGWKVEGYGSIDYICEISFTKEGKGSLQGFSFMPSCGLRQRDLKALFERIKKVIPDFALES